MTGKQLKERARARNAGGNATSKAGLVHRLIWAGDDGMPDEPPAAAGGGEASGTAHTARTTPPRKKARHSEAASADGVDDDDAMSKRPRLEHTPEPDELRVTVRDGLTLAARAWGTLRPTSSVVLALHGWLDNASSFDLIAPLLLGLPSEPYVVALDFAGHGRSDWRGRGMAGFGYHFVDFVADTKHFVDRLGLAAGAELTVLGHSMGGNVGLVLAGTFPELVSRLILVDICGPAALGDDRERPGPPATAASVLRRSIEAKEVSHFCLGRGTVIVRLYLSSFHFALRFRYDRAPSQSAIGRKLLTPMIRCR